MLITISFLFIVAAVAGFLMEKIKLPALLGYMLIGLIFSPYMAASLEIEGFFSNFFLTHKTTQNSSPVRILALCIILYRAGLGLDRAGLKENGMTTFSLSFIPCLLEAATVTYLGVLLFNLPWAEASVLGFVMAAVSPAVIVPLMLKLQEMKIGARKKIPTMILASSTVDDIIAISGFGICISLLDPNLQDNGIEWKRMMLEVPLSIITGIIISYYLSRPLIDVFKGFKLPMVGQVIALLGIAFAFKYIDENTRIPFSYLIATMSLGMSLRAFDHDIGETAAKGFFYLWKVAEIALFVLIGAMVNYQIAFDAGFHGFLILFFGLTARSVGVYICTLKSKLNMKEILFCIIAYTPKATVQATIGGIALSMFQEGKIWLYEGAETGDLILAMAAMSILITAPLGAIVTRIGSKKLLDQE